MPMQIEATIYFVFGPVQSHFSFDLVHLRMHEPWSIFPSSIQVCARDIASEIAVDYTIHIDHRVYFEDVVVEQPV